MNGDRDEDGDAAMACTRLLWSFAMILSFLCRTKCLTQQQQKKQKQDTKRKRAEMTPVGTVFICLMHHFKGHRRKGKRGYYCSFIPFRCDVPFARE